MGVVHVEYTSATCVGTTVILRQGPRPVKKPGKNVANTGTLLVVQILLMHRLEVSHGIIFVVPGSILW
jgi:hypothetical protein